MPKPGFSVITLPDQTKQELEKLALKNGESVPKTIKRLLKNCGEA